jgi:energy-coupling factor transporter ATP-binding protein EcfA2
VTFAEGIAVTILEHVTKRYPGGTVAVDDLSLEVPNGKIMILVEPSGCGKTTTLRMVNRLVEPTGGRILLNGRDVAQAPGGAAARHRLRDPADRAVPAPDRPGQHRHGPAAERLACNSGRSPSCPRSSSNNSPAARPRPVYGRVRAAAGDTLTPGGRSRRLPIS